MKRRDFTAAWVAATIPSFGRSQTGAQPDTKIATIDWPPIQLLDGTVMSPQSWQGQAAVVVVWETFCPFCKRQNAHIDKLFRATLRQRLRVLSVALDTDEGKVRRYMTANNFSFPVALDGGLLRQRLTQRRVIPMTCVLDRQGRLIQAIPGEMFEEDVMEFARLAVPLPKAI